MPAVVTKGTHLVFRTPVGGLTLAPGTHNVTNSLPNHSIDISQFSKIRVTGNNRKVSDSTITYLLTHTIGNELFTFLDKITLAPGGEFSRSYDVPGTGLAIQIQAGPGPKQDTIDVAVFGLVE